MALDIIRAKSIDDAAMALGEAGTHFVAGGTFLVRALTSGDVSIRRLVLSDELGLDRLTISDRIEIGSTVTMAQIAAEPKLSFLAPVADSIGGPAVRNMATVGGNLFARSPYGDFTVALLALGASVVSEAAGGELVDDLAAFLAGPRKTGRIVKSVRFANPPAGAFRFAKVTRKHPHGASVLSIAALLPVAGRKISGARVAYGAMAAMPMRARSVEAALEGKRLDFEIGRRRGQGRERRLLARGRSAGERLVPHRRAPRSSRPAPLGTSEQMMARTPLIFTVNGAEQAEFVEPGALLVDVLRDKLGLTGTRFGCGQGACGACTVLIDGELALSCLILAERANGAEVVTIEGIAANGSVHPLQRAFVEGFAIQCGFCTAGMIVAAKALLDRNPDPDRAEVVDAISGNICRCTGYEPIINAILSAAAEMRAAKSA